MVLSQGGCKLSAGHLAYLMTVHGRPHPDCRGARHVLNDSRARVAIVSEELLPKIEAMARDEVPWLRHLVVVGSAPVPDEAHAFMDLVDRGSAVLEPYPSHRDAAAFWLYSSGS